MNIMGIIIYILITLNECNANVITDFFNKKSKRASDIPCMTWMSLDILETNFSRIIDHGLPGEDTAKIDKLKQDLEKLQMEYKHASDSYKSFREVHNSEKRQVFLIHLPHHQFSCNIDYLRKLGLMSRTIGKHLLDSR